MILAELPGGVTHGLERRGDGRCCIRHADRRTGLTDGGESSADGQLAGDEVRAARRATCLGVIVGEPHAFLGELAQVRGLAGHDALVVGLDVKPSDVIAHDEEDVRFLVLRLRGSADASRQPEG